MVDLVRRQLVVLFLGAGERLFGETSAKRPMRLVDVRTLDGDTAYLRYERYAPNSAA